MRLAGLIIGVLLMVSAGYAQKDWPVYGGDLANTRYSSADQINAQNVSKLRQAWVYDTRADAGQKAQYQTTLDSYKKGDLAKAEGE